MEIIHFIYCLKIKFSNRLILYYKEFCRMKKKGELIHKWFLNLNIVCIIQILKKYIDVYEDSIYIIQKK